MRRFFAALGVAQVLVGAACGPLTLAPQSGSVGQRLDEPGPPTLGPSINGPRLVMDETFPRAHAWPDDPRGSAWMAADGYRLSAARPGHFVAVRAPLADAFAEVIVSATFRKVGGPPGGGYGLILDDQGLGAGDGNDQSGQYIVAEVGDRGEVGIWRRDGERWTDLVPWTPSAAVHPDARPNELSVQLLGGRLAFLVNGARVADLPRDSTVGTRPGRVGIFAGGDLNEVVVNRFRVQTPGHYAEVGPTSGQPAAAHTAPTPTSAPADMQHARDLLASIATDVGAIFDSFSGGLDDPHNPVSDPVTLQRDSARLAAATAKANELLGEMERMQHGAAGGR